MPILLNPSRWPHPCLNLVNSPIHLGWWCVLCYDFEPKVREYVADIAY